MKLLFIFLLLLLNILQILCFQNYQGFRQRRQVDGSSNGSQIDLNITVPYIFSARLYPYGTSKDDKLVQVDPTAFNLQTPLKLLDHTYNSLFVHKDGFISLSGDGNAPIPLIAVYWTKIKTGKVYFRESFDSTILNVAQNEVNIQYRYGSEFRPTSVAIITWETSDGNTDGNVFQLALILGDSGCFAHIVYSKLTSNSDAVAGFTSDDETSTYFALPGSGTPAAIQLVEKSNIGIPGEWLFRIDSEQIYLCGAGFQGLECVDSCLPTQWYLDCSKQCHCADGNPCNTETGECPDAKCNPGWIGAPICNEDIDECAENANLCPTEQPDCVNTPGAYLCLCFEYDNSTNSCLGNADKGHPEAGKSATIAVPIMELNPRLPQRIQETTQKATTRRIRPTFAFDETELLTTSTPTTTSPVTTTIRTSVTTRTRPLTFEITPLSPKQKLFNECSNCAVQSTCINGRCQCNIGWKGNGKICEDVDECSNPLTCGEHAVCQNTLGSYSCICNVGFIATSTGCKDVDECDEEIVTCKGGNTTQCINTIGGYECRCREGYTGNPEIGCRDINECEKSDFFCGSKATCVNEVGGHRCECLEGYEKLGSVCTDINECLHNPCDPAALCTNVEGTFKCDCIDGFVGNGIECHETILFPANGASPVSNAPVALDNPLTIFGNKYDKLYISDNGVISFDRSFYGPISDISEIRSNALFPFYRQNSPASVTFIEISESDASRYSLLTRASLTAQNKFKQTDFRAKTLYITTFKDDTGFAYQVVIAQSKNATYVTFLYEKIETTNGVTTGISSNNGFFNIPTELLSHNSNIGQRGKWTYRVDRASGLIPCPAGLLGAPLCQQDCPAGTWGFECINKCHCADNVPCDFGTGYCANSRCAPGFRGVNCYEDINECAEGVARCHHDAKCLNIPGGYECKCNNNFIGDGFSCVELDKCHIKYGQPCSPQGYCQISSPDEPYCTCNPGYIGDGNTCTRKVEETTIKTIERFETSTVYTTWPTKTTGRIFVEPAVSESRSTEAVDEHPFVMNNWISAEVTAPPITTPTTTASRPIITLTTRTKLPVQPKEPIGNEYTDIDNSIVEEATIEGDDDNYFTAVVILLPAALFIIWFILLIALGVYCCKRRQTARRNKYHLEMMGWSRQDYTSPRSSNFSHFAYT